MKVYESAIFSTDANGHEFCRCNHAAGIDDFADYFMSLLEAKQIKWTKSKEIPERFKTMKGMITFVIKQNGSLNRTKKTIENADHTLIITEVTRTRYDYATNRVIQNEESSFYVVRIRDANEEELLKKKSLEEKRSSFDIEKLSVKYKAIVYVDHNEDSPTSVDGQKIQFFDSFNEAKDFVEKIRKAWHMQMTLRGLSSQIKHDKMNTLTVYKPKCAFKHIHSLSFWIKSEMKYEYPNSTP